MKFTPGPFKGLMIIEPDVHKDERGYFYEGFQQERYAQHGIPKFVQDNVSRSKHNVVRGLHYQSPQTQGKLVGVTQGCVWDVVVDIRVSSASFGKWVGITLSDENHLQLYIPQGFAHGYCVLSETADFYYKCTEFYNPQSERGILWNDSELDISWPLTGSAIISAKDKTLPAMKELQHENFFA